MLVIVESVYCHEDVIDLLSLPSSSLSKYVFAYTDIVLNRFISFGFPDDAISVTDGTFRWDEKIGPFLKE